MTLYTHASRNVAKTWVLMTLFFAFITGLGWLLSQYYGRTSIVWVAVAISTTMSIISYWFSDKVVLALSGARQVAKKEDYPELYRVVENISIAAGLPMPKVYIIEERAMNAFATGRDPKHAVVAVTRGLLERLEKSELEGVIAHELSHIGNRDMLLSTVVVVLVGVISLLSDWFIRSMRWGVGGARRRDENDGSHLMFFLAILASIAAPLVALLIQLAISRKREFLADASGALLTRYPDGLAKALEKIAADATPMRHVHSATAHLYLENPFKADTRRQNVSWLTKLFLTHPPVEERIRALRGIVL